MNNPLRLKGVVDQLEQQLPDFVWYAKSVEYLHMLDHIHLMDRQIEELTRVLKERGIECQEITIPKLDDYEIETGVNGAVDD